MRFFSSNDCLSAESSAFNRSISSRVCASWFRTRSSHCARTSFTRASADARATPMSSSARLRASSAQRSASCARASAAATASRQKRRSASTRASASSRVSFNCRSMSRWWASCSPLSASNVDSRRRIRASYSAACTARVSSSLWAWSAACISASCIRRSAEPLADSASSAKDLCCIDATCALRIASSASRRAWLGRYLMCAWAQL
mmetsp:Transcript_32911/g.93562  ORF Transcript_32911/g.93562 Transcript_32911/m.93562 type:complete len:205 (-) Transcript_32911:191-805(-)